MDRLGNLKEKKNSLLEQKNKIKNEKPSKFKKILYILGIGIILISSSLTFWNTTPSLIFCITYLYIVGVPFYYSRNKLFKIWDIDSKISNIQREIDELDKTDYIEQIKMYNDINLKKKIDNVKLNGFYEEFICDEIVDDGPKLRLKK